MSDTPRPRSEPSARLLTPTSSGDTPPPHVSALLSAPFRSTGPRVGVPTPPQNSSPSPEDARPRQQGSFSTTLAFDPPAPGTCKVALADQQQRGGRVAIPVIYAVQLSGTHVAFPFTRHLLGTVWRMQADLAPHTFRELTDPDYTTFSSPPIGPPGRSGCRHCSQLGGAGGPIVRTVGIGGMAQEVAGASLHLHLLPPMLGLRGLFGCQPSPPAVSA